MPWHIIRPIGSGSHRLAVARILVKHIDGLNLHHPKPDSKDAPLAEAKTYIDDALTKL